MKLNALIAGTIIVVANAAVLVASMKEYAPHVQAASIALGLWLVGRAFLSKPATVADAEAVPQVPPPSAPPIAKNQAEAEVVAFLGILQEKGRFVDFLMDNISAYGDAQVGAAARVVHQGCQSALKEHFEISPVESANEGTQVSVAGGDSNYRLSGKLDGEGPFNGKLIHKGWKTESVKLPRVISSNDDTLPAIAPAQVELK